MAHKHDHEDHHDHHHHHKHGHGHDHDHDKASEMTFPDKMEKLLNHWIKHNRDHVQTYRTWAERALEAGMQDISKQIEEAAETSAKVDIALEKALEMLKKNT
jgi:predicted component of type VI protein secretion system